MLQKKAEVTEAERVAQIICPAFRMLYSKIT